MLATTQQSYGMNSIAHNTYQQTQVQTSDKSKLVVLMYEGAIRYCRTLSSNIENGKVEDALYHQTKALQVLNEMMNSLNSDDSELGKILFNLYEYLTVEIADINVRNKETGRLIEAIGILEDLFNTIKQAFGYKSANPKEGG